MTSEELFAAFCKTGRIDCKRLQPDGAPTPDFEIKIDGTRLAVEVKELTPNAEEETVIREFRTKSGTGEYTTYGDTVGRRIRREIESSRHQLKRMSATGVPTLLLLYDARPAPYHGVEAWDVMAAMYGFETIDIHLVDNTENPVRFGRHHLGKGNKMRPDAHAYISGIGSLWTRNADGHIHVDVFSNVHAAHPLPFAQIVRRTDMSAFTLSPGKGDEVRRWVKVPCEEEKSANTAAHGTLASSRP